MLMETSLLFKTLVILSAQIGILLLSCFYCIYRARLAYEKNTTFLGINFRGSVNLKGKLNLIPFYQIQDEFPKKLIKVITKDHTDHQEANNQEEVIRLLKDGYKHQPRPNALLASIIIFNSVVMFGTLAIVSAFDLGVTLGMTFFTLTSLSMGPIFAFIMLEMDENDGFKALKIVFLVTLLTGFIGYGDFYSFSENTIFGIILSLSLLGLIIFNLARFFIEISRSAVRVSAICGSALFSMFLLYDFNYIRQQEGTFGSNNWETAIEMAFILYLDIINLILEILEAMDSASI